MKRRNGLVRLQMAIALSALLSGCGAHYEDRDFFAKGHGIGVADPLPDKDGTWWLAVDHETAILHSGQYVQRWHADVRRDTIVIRALVVTAGRFSSWWYGNPEAGAHIDELDEGQYKVVYRDKAGQEWPLATVRARRLDIVPPQQYQWSNYQRHNYGLQPPVGAFSSRASCSTLTSRAASG